MNFYNILLSNILFIYLNYCFITAQSPPEQCSKFKKYFFYKKFQYKNFFQNLEYENFTFFFNLIHEKSIDNFKRNVY